MDRPYKEMSDELLEARLAELAREYEAVRRLKRRFKADAHAAIDRSVKAAQDRLAERLSVYDLAHSGGGPVLPTGIGDDYALGFIPEVAALWHERVDATESGGAPGAIFGPIDRSEWEAKRRAISDTEQAIERERTIRTAERQRAAAEQQLSDLARTP